MAGAATFDATAAATGICIDLRFTAAHHPLWMRWEQRLDLLLPAGYKRSVFMAAIFPEVATLAAVLAAPGWQAVAASDAPSGAERVLRAAQNALGCARPSGQRCCDDLHTQPAPACRRCNRWLPTQIPATATTAPRASPMCSGWPSSTPRPASAGTRARRASPIRGTDAPMPTGPCRAKGCSVNRTSRKILVRQAAMTTASSGLFSSGPLK